MSHFVLASTTLLLAVSVLAIAVYAIAKKPKGPLRILIVGEAKTGKTRLYHHLIHDERPETVKSAKITDFVGHILCNASREVHIFDVPSDSRCGEPEGDIAIVCIAAQDRQAAEVAAKWYARSKIGIYILEERDEDFEELLCDEIAKQSGLEHIELPENIKFVSCSLSSSWNTAAIEKVLSQL